MPRGATKSTTKWKCPKGRRSFAKRNQWHSCASMPSVADHFRGRDNSLRVQFAAEGGMDSSRVAARQKIGPGRYVYSVDVMN